MTVTPGWVPIGDLKGPKGDKGDTGDRGPKGDTGPASAGLAGYKHVQTAPAASWTVQHNLGVTRWPVVFLAGDTGPTVPDVEAPDQNTTVLIFPAPVAGVAHV